MKNFEFYAPTKIVFGRDTQSKVAALVKEFGGKKVLLHYGGKSAKSSGILYQTEQILKEHGIDFKTLGGVVPNPMLSKVREGIELCRRENIDFIVAIGGGSVIDSAKAIAYGVKYDGDVWDFYCGKANPQAILGVGAILTIAAAGSEMSDSSVITNDDGLLKRGCSSDLGRCKFAIMNPELTCTLPDYQTASGCVDIIMHTLERYFSTEDETKLQDAIAEALVKTVIENAKILQTDPKNYNARAEVMWASTLSHNGITGNRFVSDWACHQLEHELSGMFGVAHGAGLSAIWGTWARYVLPTNPARFAKLGAGVFGIHDEDKNVAALKTISAMENFFAAIGMPISIRDMQIILDDTQIEKLAENCSFGNTRTIGAFKKLDISDMKKIYLEASK